MWQSAILRLEELELMEVWSHYSITESELSSVNNRCSVD